MVARTKYLSHAETQQLLKSVKLEAHEDQEAGRQRGPLAWLLVDVALGTGLRVSEIAAIHIEHIDFRRGFLTVRRLKKRKVAEDILPLDPQLVKHLKKFIGKRGEGTLFLGQRGAVGPKGLYKIWSKALARAGLQHLGIHGARHTLAVALLKKTNNLRIVQKTLGHGSVTTTANLYADVPFEDMAKAITDLY